MGVKMKLINIFIVLGWLLTGQVGAGDFSVYEANYPQVKDYNVKVDTTVLWIQPRGAYIEFDLEITVSYNFESWFFKNYTELELQWLFALPDHAIVDDFWIWQGDSILKPTIMDKWTAELLFSEVSSPVRNPGLLTQSFPNREGQVWHSLRLYPVIRNDKRKFKIHYLLPARPTNETLRIWLPTSQLTSRLSPGADSLKVIFLDERKPDFIGAEPAYEKYRPEISGWEFKIGLDYDRLVELVYPAPIMEKYFFSTFEDSAESYYQLAVYPPEVQEDRTPRNFLILVDFNRFNTAGFDGELVMQLLKETMQQALSADDSANLIVSYEDLKFGADQFLACDEQNIDILFENTLRRSFPAYSNFQELIVAAAKFLENRSDSTDIILLTNTDEINLASYAKDELADKIIAMFNPAVKIHVVDLENISYLIYNYGMSRYETQLQSFYARLCYQSAGNLFFLRYHSIKNILAALFYEKISHFEEVEVQTRFAAGYAYGKHFLALHEGYYPFKFPLMQVGRYRGSLPLEVTVLGKIRLDKVSDEFTINQLDVTPGNSSLKTAWFGDHIHELLKQSQNNATIVDIMDLSLQQNILTPYTGFLIFRPDENNGFESDGDDKDFNPRTDVATTVRDSLSTEIELAAYPNPFNEKITIRFSLGAQRNLSEISLTIFNSLGQKVRKIELDNRQRITWRGRDDNFNHVASGVYIAVLTGPNRRQALKLVLMK